MKRRTFLTLAGIGGGLAALASARFVTTSFEQSVKRLIKKEVGFLKLDEKGVSEFASQYGQIKDGNYKLIIKSYSLLGITAAQSGKIHQLVSDYLLSTDFFINKMDESLVIKYVGIYNPHTRPCAHPFSHLLYPGKTPGSTSTESELAYVPEDFLGS